MSYPKEDGSCWYRYYQTILINISSTMHSHTCTSSGSLSFRCDSIFSYKLLGAGPLPAFISLKHYISTKRRRYIPTSFRLVHPRTTSCYKRSPLIPLITSQTARRIADWPYKPTRVFSACFVLACMLTGKLSRSSPIPIMLQVKHT